MSQLPAFLQILHESLLVTNNSWGREPTEYPVAQRALVLHRLHTPLRRPELKWWLCNQLLQGLSKRLYHLVAVSPRDWTLELSQKHTAHAGFRY